MSSMRLTLCAGAVVAAALTAVPVAYAAGGGVTVTPASPAPGTDVRLVVRGCTGKTGTAKSEAFVADVLLAARGPDGALVGGSRVRSSLAPGTYDVTVGCDGQNGKVKGALAVFAKGGPGEGAGKPSPGRPSTNPSAGPSRGAASPVAPVPAGGGGAAEELAAAERLADDARGAGPGTRQAVVGLVLAGVAAVVVAVRGFRRGRGTD
ncbi:hypothetical protein PV396_21850 [Streptomyces sp. ME02-8801-2C]|uniref:hypothetical protein n=1 Tax=Streptomyces sp. ME02-8801-2C TaxID=3028680 RepID=UPI0029B8AECE|nr:hypothetical protein [Streptomyces sp. ME02-8801-2C]MDX3454558.1 hypothetical protein [Streptomyces sp. ME02-8801-2C]